MILSGDLVASLQVWTSQGRTDRSLFTEAGMEVHSNMLYFLFYLYLLLNFFLFAHQLQFFSGVLKVVRFSV